MSEERRDAVVRLLSGSGYLTVEDIAKRLYVSVPTVRRDLKKLADKGLIKRVHGGASYVGQDTFEWPFDMRSRVNLQEKRLIAQAAADLIEDGAHIFLDAGSTCYFLAEALDPKLHLTVLCNGLSTVERLGTHVNTLIECPGGQYRPSHWSIFGEEAASFISTRHADYYFASATALHSGTGASIRTLLEMSVKRAMHAHADCTVLLMDHSKMETQNYYHVFDLSEIDILVTNAPLPKTMAKACRDAGVTVMLPDKKKY
ncbi:MAG: DeoR/GlpR transcriptional regulator [Lachnospiraceae bacterium]|nr:DeoR/GlpR transcriptional regulator [Lachnospiraceae bacterium]